MNNLGTALLRVVVLTGGAVVGALLARWCDEYLSSHVQERSEYDRTRYEQGLAPISSEPRLEEQQR